MRVSHACLADSSGRNRLPPSATMCTAIVTPSRGLLIKPAAGATKSERYMKG